MQRGGGGVSLGPQGCSSRLPAAQHRATVPALPPVPFPFPYSPLLVLFCGVSGAFSRTAVIARLGRCSVICYLDGKKHSRDSGKTRGEKNKERKPKCHDFMLRRSSSQSVPAGGGRERSGEAEPGLSPIPVPSRCGTGSPRRWLWQTQGCDELEITCSGRPGSGAVGCPATLCLSRGFNAASLRMDSGESS